VLLTEIGDATTRPDDHELERSDHELYGLRLYVAGAMPTSTRAINNLTALCEGRLKGRHQLDVIDIFQHPELAEAAEIVGLPTLVQHLPPPLRRFFGDLSDLEGNICGLRGGGASDDVRRKEEAEANLRAIHEGRVDALVVSGTNGGQVLVLKGEEQSSRAFVETMNKGALTLLADGTITYSNRSFAEMLKSPLEGVVGKPLEEFVAPDHRQRVRVLLERALANAGEDVIQFRASDGAPVFVEISLSPTELEHAPGISVIASNVTERRKTEDLRSYLAAIVTSSDDAIVGKDLDGTILSWNRGAEILYGYTASEVIGRSISILEPPDHAGETASMMERVRRGDRIDHFETERLRKSGVRVGSTVTISPIRDGNGKVIGASSIARDTTETAKVAGALRVSAVELQEAQRVAHLGHWTMDAKTGQVTSWSDEIYIMLGLDPALPAIPSSGQTKIFTAESSARLAAAVGETLHSGASYELDLEVVRPDGKAGWIFVRGEAIRDGKGAIAGMRGIAQDITERKLARRQIEEMNGALERRVAERTAELLTVNKELETFSYSVSHDLRAPLRAIDGFCQALTEDYADKLDFAGKDYLQRVRLACQRMDGLIDGMLVLSRTNRNELCRTTVDLSALAQTIATNLQMAEPGRHVEFVIAPGLRVNVDAGLLQTVVLQNLLENAWKFTSKHPQARIEVGTLQHEGETAYFVRDDGAGFNMAYAGKLFGVFQRLHNPREFEGTGIGLANVQRVINRHGGQIWAESAVEHGATFFFTLPCKPKGTI